MMSMRQVERRAMAALVGRETRRVLVLWTQTVLPAVVTGVLFLAIFGGALGGALREVAGVPYLSFILPGLLVMTMTGQAFGNNSTSVFQARNEGYIEDVLTSPLKPWQMTIAYASGGLLRAWLASIAIAALALPFVQAPPTPVVAIAALVLASIVFASLGVIVGVWADTFDQHSFISNIVITPLALTAGVFYAPENLPEPWSSLTRLNPIYYLVDATRTGLTGHGGGSVLVSLGVAAVVAVASFVAATTLVSRGWRLKP